MENLLGPSVLGKVPKYVEFKAFKFTKSSRYTFGWVAFDGQLHLEYSVID